MDKVQKILQILKPKVQAFGFSKEEVKGIAADIADDLELDDNASEEDVNNTINAAIDKEVKFLKYAQKAGNRMIEDWKKQHPEPKPKDDDDDDDDDDDNDDDDDDDGAPKKSPKNDKKNPKDGGKKSSKKSTKTDNDDQPAWVKELQESVKTLSNEITNIKSKGVSDKRKERLEALVKDTGVFGKRTMKSFSKMNFEDDDEFEEFINGIEEDLKEFNQERADAGLSKLGNPPITGKKGEKEEDEPEVISDDLIKELAKD